MFKIPGASIRLGFHNSVQHTSKSSIRCCSKCKGKVLHVSNRKKQKRNHFRNSKLSVFLTKSFWRRNKLTSESSAGILCPNGYLKSTQFSILHKRKEMHTSARSSHPVLNKESKSHPQCLWSSVYRTMLKKRQTTGMNNACLSPTSCIEYPVTAM